MMPRQVSNFFIFFIVLNVCLVLAGGAEESPSSPDQAMTLERLDELVARIDQEAEKNGNQWLLRYEEMEVLIVTDPTADRMRVMTPVAPADAIDEKDLYRLMQANFESALDARYAIAQGMLWSTFIHPLSPLTDEQFFSGVGQTLTLVTTYGSTYSSGALLFGGGDGAAESELPYDDIIKRGEST